MRVSGFIFRLLNVIHHVRKNQAIKSDLLLLTGDLSQDESMHSYLKLRELIEGLLIPTYWIQGNHDNIEIRFKNLTIGTANLFL